MYRIALTGGVGSGKSVVASLFAQLHVPIIDCDHLAHELTAQNTPAYKKIVQHFGNTILLADKNLDRRKLAHIVFSKSNEKIWLEDVLHPLIKEEVIRRMQKLTIEKDPPYCIVVVPLLLENRFQFEDLFDRTLVVDCKIDVQIERIRQRDKRSVEEIKAILGAQASREKRLEVADDVIENSDLTMDELKLAVKALHEKYLKAATVMNT